jgi:hypothetical protein
VVVRCTLYVVRCTLYVVGGGKLKEGGLLDHTSQAS